MSQEENRRPQEQVHRETDAPASEQHANPRQQSPQAPRQTREDLGEETTAKHPARDPSAVSAEARQAGEPVTEEHADELESRVAATSDEGEGETQAVLTDEGDTVEEEEDDDEEDDGEGGLAQSAERE
jgi:hypothetical protein